jgi:hypothetical protein
MSSVILEVRGRAGVEVTSGLALDTLATLATLDTLDVEDLRPLSSPWRTATNKSSKNCLADASVRLDPSALIS